MNNLTIHELDRLELYLDKLNASIGLQSETIKDVRYKISVAKKELNNKVRE